MYDICTIGHITKDRIVTSQAVKYMPGGTAFYFSKALKHFDINCMLLTAVAESEMPVITKLAAEGIKAHALPSELSEKRKSKVNFHKKQEFQVPTSTSFNRVFAVANCDL